LSAGSQQLTSPRKLSPLGLQFIRLSSFRSDGKPATAESAKQMLHMPGVVHAPPRLAADASQMAKADDDSHFESLSDSSWRCPPLSPAALWIPISIASVKSKPLIDERPKSFRCAPIPHPARWPFLSLESGLCTSHPRRRKLGEVFPAPSVSLP
jgi:hypothetical protein